MSVPPDHPITSAMYNGGPLPIAFSVDPAQETIWATQRQMATLFGRDTDTIGHHISQLYSTGEFDREATTAKFAVVQKEGSRCVERIVDHYNFDVIMVIGYRVNGPQASAFRRWANDVLKRYLISGYALNTARLSNDETARDELAAELRKLRLSDRALYKKLTDTIAATSADYEAAKLVAPKRITALFIRIQDTFHLAVTGKTAQELVIENADGSKPLVGMLSYAGHPERIKVADVRTGKNYLEAIPFRKLEILYEQLLLFAEHRILSGERMSLDKWADQIDSLLKANGYQPWKLYNGYKASEADAVAAAELKTYKARIKALPAAA